MDADYYCLICEFLIPVTIINLMNAKRLLALAVIFLSVIAQASVVRVKVRNLGDGTVSYMKSTDGMITKCSISPELDSDSCFTIDLGGYEGIDVITFNCRKGKEYLNKSVWVPFVRNVEIDFNAENKIESDENASIKAADGIATGFLHDFYSYMDGEADPLHLRGDTVSGSVYGKLVNRADSLVWIIEKSVPENIAKVFRQGIAINTLYWFRQCYGRAVNGRQPISARNKEEWADTFARMKKDLDLNAPENALSYLFRNTAYCYFSDYAEKENLITEPASKEVWDRLFFDYVKDNLKGKAAQTLCGDIIVGDTEQEIYSKWIPELAAKFHEIYPGSSLEPVVNAAVVKNREMNAPKDMTGINFITAGQAKDVAGLISRYKGKPVLVDIWATWCGPCRRSFKEIAPIREFAKEKGIVLLYISIDESENAMETVKDVVGLYGLKGDHIVVSGELREDVFATFGNSRGILSVPHSAFFNKEGEMVVKRFQESELPSELLKKLKTIVP